MSNLLFTTLIIVLIYYFFYYLPSQKKLTTANPPLKHHQTTQTESKDTLVDPGPQLNPQELEKLKKEIKQKDQTITNLTKLETNKTKQITKLQAQIRDLAKKPTNSKATQTGSEKEGVYSELSQTELSSTLDTLIKDIQTLNNEL